MALRALLGFAPFIAFALMEKLVGIVPALSAGFAVSLVLVMWEAVRHRTFNILEGGSAVIFGTLSILALGGYTSWTIWSVRLYVDGGLALTVFLSVMIRQPFTLQATRKMASSDVACGRDFLRRNDLVSTVWGLAFSDLAAVDLYMTANPGVPDRRGITATLIILAAAAKFTQWYVKRA